MASPERDLFGNPPTHAQQVAAKSKAKRKPTPARGYAFTPGTGPEGETCGSCRHIARTSGDARIYIKCGLMRAKWTKGPGSDIRAQSPACKEWEAKAA